MKYKLYDERKRDNTVLIKVAYNIWIPKARWVWLETHPESIKDYDPARDVFIHLDGNKDNLNPSNIEKVTKGERCRINSEGGIPKGSDPEVTRIRIENIRLKFAIFDAGERIGTVKSYEYKGNVMRFTQHQRNEYYKKYVSRLSPEQKEIRKTQQREYYREYYKDPKKREARNKRQRDHYNRMKNDPEFMEKRRAAVKKNRKKIKNTCNNSENMQ